jgi:hypothetical protein
MFVDPAWAKANVAAKTPEKRQPITLLREEELMGFLL